MAQDMALEVLPVDAARFPRYAAVQRSFPHLTAHVRDDGSIKHPTGSHQFEAIKACSA
jgi:hypothetical protein